MICELNEQVISVTSGQGYNEVDMVGVEHHTTGKTSVDAIVKLGFGVVGDSHDELLLYVSLKH